MDNQGPAQGHRDHPQGQTDHPQGQTDCSRDSQTVCSEPETAIVTQSLSIGPAQASATGNVG